MPVSGGTEPLALDELGWRQFVDLCMEVVQLDHGVPARSWVSEEDRAWHVTVPGKLRDPSARHGGGCYVQPIWIPAHGDRAETLEQEARALCERLASERWGGSIALITNLGGVFFDGASSSGVLKRGPLEALGAEWLTARVDEDPRLRIAMPSLLGLADPERWLAGEVRSRSTLELEAARELAEVFVPTAAYKRALEVLGAHHFAVLTGPPEMGKTSIARMLALALMTDGWEAYECTAPEQIFDVFDAGRRQVFVADDAFGSTEYRPESAERWAREMERLLRMMDARHSLIWTSRPAPLHAGLDRIHRERGAERFPRPGEVLVDAGNLSLDEKVLILLRHAKAQLSPIARWRLRAVGYEIVSHTHFTPERIRRLVCEDENMLRVAVGQELQQLIERQIQTPTEAMQASFAALSVEHRALLFAMLDTRAGPVEERELAHLARVHAPRGLSRPPMELVDRLTDHFLRVSETLKVEWVHPSWRDLVIERLRADRAAREAFLTRCGLQGVVLAISVGGGVGGERTLALLLSDHDWDLATDRIVGAIREESDSEVVLVLDQLTAAVEGTSGNDPRQLDELRALATTALEAAARRFDATTRALEVDLIRAWLRLAHRLPTAPGPPRLGRTCAELLPGDATDLRIARDLDQALAWLELGSLLRQYSFGQASAYGTRDDEGERIAALLAQAERLLTDDRFEGDQERLVRLLRLCRAHGLHSAQMLTRYDQLIYEAGESHAADAPAAPFPFADLSRRAHVERILEDL